MRLLSDTHLEYGHSVKLKYYDDILILAGDIFNNKLLNNSTLDFLEQVEKNYKKVFYILGNHEYYKNNIHDDVCNLYKQLLPVNVILLENESYPISDKIEIYAGTMWSNIKNNEPLIELKIMNRINDFKYIENLKFEIIYSKFNSYIENLKIFLDRCVIENKKAIVVSHFAPSYNSIHSKYRNSNDYFINYYFFTELDRLILKYTDTILYWFHGHNHDPFDYKIGNTKILANPFLQYDICPVKELYIPLKI